MPTGRVPIFWPHQRLPFLVLYVDPQYRYVIYGEADRKLIGLGLFADGR